MSTNFDLLCARVRIRDHIDTTGELPRKTWPELHPGNRNIYREQLRAMLKCLVEDGYDFGGVENECTLEKLN